MTSPARPERPAGPARPRGEHGFAMLTVVGAMFVLTVMSLLALSTAVNGLTPSRKVQDSAAALAAAQAGLDDYLARLNRCDSYWLPGNTCPSSGTNRALNAAGASPWSWETIDPADDGGTLDPDPRKPRFGYAVLLTPDQSTGLIRLESRGLVNGVQRVVTADLRKPGFLRYIYYTDVESMDPAQVAAQYPRRRYDVARVRYRDSSGTLLERTLTNVTYDGVPAAESEKCARYWYGERPEEIAAEPFSGTTSSGTTFADREPRDCDIHFAGTDVIRGPLHTNDAILLADGVTFEDSRTGTSWPAGATPAPSTTAWYRSLTSGAAPSPSSARPGYAPPVVVPASGTGTVRDAAARNGCVFTGPTRVEFLASGAVRVHSPSTRTETLSAACGAGTGLRTALTEIQGPPNGVLYVQSLAEDNQSVTCSGRVLGTYPVDGDVTRYDCRNGDAFVSGVVGRPLTVATTHDVVVTHDITYAAGLSGDDVLGLIAAADVEVYHPVRCKVTPSAGTLCPLHEHENIQAPRDFTIHAAILSLAHSFRVQHHDKGLGLGTLRVYGGIYQKYRGAVGLGSGAGYGKDYHYDPRLIHLPPPFFVEPTAVAWVVTNFAEEKG